MATILDLKDRSVLKEPVSEGYIYNDQKDQFLCLELWSNVAEGYRWSI